MNKQDKVAKKDDKKGKSTNSKTCFLKFFILFVILTIVIVATFFIFKITGIWEKVNSIDKIRKIVESGGVFSFIIFMLLQILQTTVLQIPSILVTIAGSLIFGKWTAFILSFISVMIGSLIMFWIGRKCGKKFLYWLAGKDNADKWMEKLTNGKYLFFLMMMFPLFPDDILCAVAGVTNMSFGFFFWTNVVARGLGIACTVFFGSGSVIPFRGWGLVVWGVIGVLIVIIFYLSIRYKDKIDEIVKKFFKKDKGN